MAELKGESLQVQRLKAECVQAWKELELQNAEALQQQANGAAGPEELNYG